MPARAEGDIYRRLDRCAHRTHLLKRFMERRRPIQWQVIICFHPRHGLPHNEHVGNLAQETLTRSACYWRLPDTATTKIAPFAVRNVCYRIKFLDAFSRNIGVAFDCSSSPLVS